MKRLIKPKSSSNEPSIKAEYSFYLENQTDKKFSLKLDAIKKKYIAFLKDKDKMTVSKKGKQKETWSQYYGDKTVVAFVTQKEGLNSTIEVQELLSLEAALKPTRKSLYSK